MSTCTSVTVWLIGLINEINSNFTYFLQGAIYTVLKTKCRVLGDSFKLCGQSSPSPSIQRGPPTSGCAADVWHSRRRTRALLCERNSMEGPHRKTVSTSDRFGRFMAKARRKSKRRSSTVIFHDEALQRYWASLADAMNVTNRLIPKR